MPFIEPKSCPKCGKPMRAFPATSRPASSEWYCEPCHTSVLMERDEARYFVNLKKQQMAEA